MSDLGLTDPPVPTSDEGRGGMRKRSQSRKKSYRWGDAPRLSYAARRAVVEPLLAVPPSALCFLTSFQTPIKFDGLS